MMWGYKLSGRWSTERGNMTYLEIAQQLRKQIPTRYENGRPYRVALPSGGLAWAYYGWGRGRNAGKHYFHWYYEVPMIVNGQTTSLTEKRHFVMDLGSGRITERG